MSGAPLFFTSVTLLVVTLCPPWVVVEKVSVTISTSGGTERDRTILSVDGGREISLGHRGGWPPWKAEAIAGAESRSAVVRIDWERLLGEYGFILALASFFFALSLRKPEDIRRASERSVNVLDQIAAHKHKAAGND